MARGRLISKSLGSSQKYHAALRTGGPIGEFCQLLYPLLVANTDDYGRFYGDAFTVRHRVLPSSPRTERDFAKALHVLAKVELIQLYDVHGKTYLQVFEFDAHQPNLHKRSKVPLSRRLPAPPGASGSSGNIPDLPGESGTAGEKPVRTLNLEPGTWKARRSRRAGPVIRKTAAGARNGDGAAPACPHNPRCAHPGGVYCQEQARRDLEQLEKLHTWTATHAPPPDDS